MSPPARVVPAAVIAALLVIAVLGAEAASASAPRPPDHLGEAPMVTPGTPPSTSKRAHADLSRRRGRALDQSDDRQGTEARCDSRPSSTLLETGKVRIYALPPEPTDHPEHREPAIAGRSVYGCLKSSGSTRFLDLPEVDDERPTLWVEVASQVLAANGPLVAYPYTQYYFDTHETWVRVRNLRTGEVIRDCFIGGALAPHRLPRVTDIVLHSNGEVDWSATSEGPVAGREPESACNGSG